MATINYQDKPEYLTMWLCIILCAHILSADLSYLGRNRSKMVTLLKRHFKDHRMAAHPDTLLVLLQTENKGH